METWKSQIFSPDKNSYFTVCRVENTVKIDFKILISRFRFLLFWGLSMRIVNPYYMVAFRAIYRLMIGLKRWHIRRNHKRSYHSTCFFSASSLFHRLNRLAESAVSAVRVHNQHNFLENLPHAKNAKIIAQKKAG